MARESVVFGLLTVVIVVGSIVLLAGVGAFEHMRLDVIGAGSAIMVVGILGLAGFIGLLPDHEGHTRL
jgi:hypothetical protein